VAPPKGAPRKQDIILILLFCFFIFVPNYSFILWHEQIPYLGYTNVMEDWDLVYGLHEVQREGVVEADGDPANRVLITAGVGTTPPFRLGIPPEVVLLTLVPRS
jgi:hypothetical protein